MATATLTPSSPPVEFLLRRFTVAEYDQMIRDGTINEDERVELLDGWIVEKMAHNAPHDSTVSKLQRTFVKRLGDDWWPRGQSSVTLDVSVPEPDIALIPGPLERYDEERPRPRDLALVVEVSESSLARDRGPKLRMYARNKIPVYWIVNLEDRVVEVYTDPRGGKAPAYRNQTDYRHGQSIPIVVAGKTLGSIPVSEFLP